MTRRRLGCLLLLAGLLLLCVSCWVFGLVAPKQAGATALETVVIEIPPYPTQVPYPYPTVCVTAVPEPSCGVAAITVGHTNGEQGLLVLLVLVALFGFAFLGVCVLVVGFVRF